MTTLLTWYFLTTNHAAYWHNQTPADFPTRPTYTHLACACPKEYPFGTRFLFRRDNKWAEAICVDRTKSGDSFDAWPELARRLGFGPTYKNDAGIIPVSVWPLNTRR